MRLVDVEIHAGIVDYNVDALGALLPDDGGEVGDTVGFGDVESVPLD